MVIILLWVIVIFSVADFVLIYFIERDRVKLHKKHLDRNQAMFEENARLHELVVNLQNEIARYRHAKHGA